MKEKTKQRIILIAISIAGIGMIAGTFLSERNRYKTQKTYEKRISSLQDSLTFSDASASLYAAESQYYLCQLIIAEGANDKEKHDYTEAMVEWANNSVEEAELRYMKLISDMPERKYCKECEENNKPK